jgi:hypothetical protein
VSDRVVSDGGMNITQGDGRLCLGGTVGYIIFTATVAEESKLPQCTLDNYAEVWAEDVGKRRDSARVIVDATCKPKCDDGT